MTHRQLQLQNWKNRDFRGGPVVKNSPASAGDMGSVPGLGRSLMPQRNQARVSQLLKSVCPRTCSATREATTVRSPYTTAREQPQLSKTRESPHAATKTQCGQNSFLKKEKFKFVFKKKNLKNRKFQDLAQHPPVSLRISTQSSSEIKDNINADFRYKYTLSKRAQYGFLNQVGLGSNPSFTIYQLCDFGKFS